MGWHATKRQIAYIRVLVNQLGWGNDPDIGITAVLGERPEPERFGQTHATKVIQELKQIKYRTGANHPVKNMPKSFKKLAKKKPRRRTSQQAPPRTETRDKQPAGQAEGEIPWW